MDIKIRVSYSINIETQTNDPLPAMTYTTQATLSAFTSTATVTKCSECPFFASRQDGTDKGWCRAFEQPAREHHTPVIECHQTILVERESNLALPAPKPTVKPTVKPKATKKDELQVYLSPKAGRYIVKNLTNNTRYTVQFFGDDGIVSCSCPHHQKRSHTAGFVDKHIDAVEQALFSKIPLTREPITLQEVPYLTRPTFHAYIGDKPLGLVSSQKMADHAADKWFKDEQRCDNQNRNVIAKYQR